MNELTVKKVTPFSPNTNLEPDGRARNALAVASVTLGIGPVRLQAKLYQRVADDKLFLVLPGHPTSDNKYFDYVRIDYSAKQAVEERAIQLFHTQN